ncbi:RND efflux system membrane fusion protein (plasmid) [Sulfuricella denitrificans skB26]|uniref:RND efflux system membrane fusion protein n=1 Tax=Sulfuricella denitrificans (strain DSM 22764 / NBRC 105220 / skB26) TaxID=1163617 RepID=S6APM8_SULDS|nr:biotin/lipoyl-binding protein [Sulfuricella denitrificans]BAN36894.1 RND efflux system membrane fusion protein [Sulfuricella denitrificans skB26]
MKKKTVIIILTIVALVGAGMLVKHQKSRLTAEKPPASVPVAVEARQLVSARFALTLPLVAEVQAVQEANIASRLTGYVAELRYLEGDRFRKGDVLVRLDDADAQSQLQRAEADLARTRLQQGSLNADLAAAKVAAQAARDRAARADSLYKIKGVSLEQLQSEQSNQAAAEARLSGTQAAVDGYQASLRATEAAVRSARENLAYAVIRAPFNGMVAARPVQPGDLATPGKPLLRLVALGESRLLVNLPDISRPVALRWQGRDLPLKPWPEAGAQGMRRYEARADGLTPGSRVSVKLVTFSGQGVFLPDTCLLNNDGHSATIFQLAQSGPARPLTVELAASGSEGVASTDARLNGATIACGGPDVLTRLILGTPFKITKGG